MSEGWSCEHDHNQKWKLWILSLFLYHRSFLVFIPYLSIYFWTPFEVYKAFYFHLLCCILGWLLIIFLLGTFQKTERRLKILFYIFLLPLFLLWRFKQTMLNFNEVLLCVPINESMSLWSLWRSKQLIYQQSSAFSSWLWAFRCHLSKCNVSQK